MRLSYRILSAAKEEFIRQDLTAKRSLDRLRISNIQILE